MDNKTIFYILTFYSHLHFFDLIFKTKFKQIPMKPIISFYLTYIK